MGLLKAIGEGILIGIAVWLIGTGLVYLHDWLDLSSAMEAFATITTAAVIVSVSKYFIYR